MADDTSAPDHNSGSNGRSGLPKGFPHASRLERAGVTSLAKLREIDSLEELTGIGPAYAEDIEQALAERGEVENGKQAATTEKRPSPLDEDEETDIGGAATQQSIDIPAGPLEETVSYDTYPADTYEHDALGFEDGEVIDLLREHGHVGLPDIAEAVTVRQLGKEITEISPERVKDTYMMLYHSDIPKLVDENVIVYDQEQDIVATGENFSAVEELLSRSTNK